MTKPKGPVIIEYETDPAPAKPGPKVKDAPPRIETTVDPAAAPPVPDEEAPAPEGRAMMAVTRIASRRMGWFGQLAWAAISGLILLWLSTAAWDFAMGLLERNIWLGRAGLLLGAIVAIAVLVIILRELSGFARLSRLDKIRKTADDIRAAPTADGAEAVSHALTPIYKGRDDMRWALDDLGKHDMAIMDGTERLDLIETTLMTPLDEAAQSEIESAARQVATVTAIVPLRAVATHLVATGAVGVADDLIGSVAGGGAVAKLSRRFGEGIINGALTARVGLAAMDVCRPMPFSANDRPKVSDVVGRALTGMFTRS